MLGAGHSGIAAARLAKAKGAKVTLFDSRADATFPNDLTGQAGVTSEIAKSVVSDLVVLSPGIATNSDFVRAFVSCGAPLVGEIELASLFYPGRVVAITGTNGKTTTTELISAFLNGGEISCKPCGNYGVPFSEVALEESPPEAAALEVSSFQLETIKTFHPEVAVWMNFAPDHMDRYPDLESYRAAKLRIFENLTANDVRVVRAGEGLSGITFSAQSQADYGLHSGKITKAGDALLDFTKSRLRGRHNAENVMAAAAVATHFGVNPAQMQRSLEAYQPPAHRCELIRTIGDVEYVNDSKATNIHALASALASQERPIVLLAGGKEKGLDYSSVPDLLRQHVLSCVTYGEIGNKLNLIFAEAVPVVTTSTLEEAVREAHRSAPQGSMVLLSPGTSSFDQFKSYEARGDAFRQFVTALKEPTPTPL